MTIKHSPLRMEIDAAAIVHNCGVLKSACARSCRMCVAIKCNAYGHGVDWVLPALKSVGVDMLAVATVCEAARVRELNWQGPILLLGSELSGCQGGQRGEVAQWLVENEVRVTPMYCQDIDALAEAAYRVNKKASIHLKLDTGMGRMGLKEKDIWGLISRVRKYEQVHIEGLYTHLASADLADKSFSYQQLQAFDCFLNGLLDRGLKISIVHAANSAATIDLPESHYDMIRPGISIYGYAAGPEMHNKPDLKPAMKLVSHLTAVKQISEGDCVGYGCTWRAPEDTFIGLVPIGYGDGYSRHLSNIGKMSIAQMIVTVVGRISMDITAVDLTPLIKKGIRIAPGQEITIIDNDSQALNSIESLAYRLNTIPYEIITQFGGRVTRSMAQTSLKLD